MTKRWTNSIVTCLLHVTGRWCWHELRLLQLFVCLFPKRRCTSISDMSTVLLIPRLKIKWKVVTNLRSTVKMNIWEATWCMYIHVLRVVEHSASPLLSSEFCWYKMSRLYICYTRYPLSTRIVMWQTHCYSSNTSFVKRGVGNSACNSMYRTSIFLFQVQFWNFVLPGESQHKVCQRGVLLPFLSAGPLVVTLPKTLCYTDILCITQSLILCAPGLLLLSIKKCRAKLDAFCKVHVTWY